MTPERLILIGILLVGMTAGLWNVSHRTPSTGPSIVMHSELFDTDLPPEARLGDGEDRDRLTRQIERYGHRCAAAPEIYRADDIEPTLDHLQVATAEAGRGVWQIVGTGSRVWAVRGSPGLLVAEDKGALLVCLMAEGVRG